LEGRKEGRRECVDVWGPKEFFIQRRHAGFRDGHRERYHTALKHARDLYAIERKDGADAHAWDRDGFYIPSLDVGVKCIGTDGRSICGSISNPIGSMYSEWESLRIRVSN
jgi:hypothetical protein